LLEFHLSATCAEESGDESPHSKGLRRISFCLLLLGGCASHADRLRDVRNDFYAGNLDRSVQAIDKRLRNKHDSDVFKLDRAIVQLAAGKPKECESLLREVRDRFDYLEQTSVPEQVLAAMTDDQRLAYAGEDYEKILIRAFLALANLLGDGEDAAAYALQVTDKQQQIMDGGADEMGDNPKLRYRRIALGAYIHGLLREETQSNYDDAERAYQKVVEWEPAFRSGAEDLERARTGHHSALGHGVLYVFALVGRGPYKEEVAELPTSAALLIADRIVSHTASHTLPPTIAPIKAPRVVLTRNAITAIRVECDGQHGGTTETIADVGQWAVDQYDAIYPRVMARAVARRVIKKGVVYGAKEAIHTDNPLIELAFDAGGVVWEATEAADTRCWGLLPDKIQVLRLELPVGDHRLTLRAASGSNLSGSNNQVTVRIVQGRNTYVLANFPDMRMVGTVLTGPAGTATR
jgi:hypothetical protein